MNICPALLLFSVIILLYRVITELSCPAITTRSAELSMHGSILRTNERKREMGTKADPFTKGTEQPV